MPLEVAPRWALCSDCRFENLPTCSDEPTCWHPMTIADLEPDKPMKPWMVQHFTDNPTHTVRETINEPAHCLTCGAKSPAWDLKKTTIEIGPLSVDPRNPRTRTPHHSGDA